MNLLFLNGLLDSVMLSRWMAEQRLDLRQRLKALLSVSTGILSVYLTQHVAYFLIALFSAGQQSSYLSKVIFDATY